jgi:hypothetical protein
MQVCHWTNLGLRFDHTLCVSGRERFVRIHFHLQVVLPFIALVPLFL